MAMCIILRSCVFILFYHMFLVSGLEIQNAENPDRIPNEYLIQLYTKGWLLDSTNSETKEAKITEIVKKITDAGNTVEVVRKYVFRKLVILSVRCEIEASVASLLSLPEVQSIEANVQVKAFSSCKRQTLSFLRWSLPRIARRQPPSSLQRTYEYMEKDGEDTYAYVVDTGIYIENNYFEGRASHGFVAQQHFLEGPDDRNGHGTHCAGSVMSNVFGVAKKAHAISVKVLGIEGSGSAESIVHGLNWVFQNFTESSNNFKAVVSLSLGGGYLPTVDNVVQELIDEGLTVVVAAGNSDDNACLYSPAKVTDAITVGASDSSDDLASYSNWGSCVDIIAPGSNIESTGIGYQSSTATLSGTSMATPHVAGAILRYMSQISQRPSPRDVKNWLLSSASINRINLRETRTPNRLLFAQCDVHQIAYDPNMSNVFRSTWALVLLNTLFTSAMILLV